ncbi:unnamed protein product [Acanthoscelides obtectus]|uniref:PiggyBac transposable element-derived protein domain-containing protein n=1 Tax=Acanthoscelides obtectus TaxID=200917 RepID=A0A9P0LSU1_ACAOB|nr:unnamed protein product [Acanthoscelides obtectus]CAK1657196.1 PiggyBac transposable element-derived protein 4 [Acanthoscelides obtectus]
MSDEDVERMSSVSAEDVDDSEADKNDRPSTSDSSEYEDRPSTKIATKGIPNHGISADSGECTSSNVNIPLRNDSNKTLFVDKDNITWRNPSGRSLNNFDCDTTHGIPSNIVETFIGKTELEIFKLFVDDELIDLMVRETNRYAEQVITEKICDDSIPRHSRLNDWVETSAIEIHVSLGIILWMGLDRKPSLSHYWSRSELYNSPACKYQECFIPSETVCIDETMVPFRGRLRFRQYMKGKRHKFGIKIFKLCGDGGYTYNMKIYCGKESKRDGVSVADKVVFELKNNLLDSGRILVTDNWYTSVGLVRRLLARSTHLVGTLRSNRKCNPKNVITTSLKRGQILGMESDDGITVFKWKDKRDVLMLTTKHSTEKSDQERQRPVAIMEYNAGKSFIDISDQKSSYSSAVRKALKWYRKVAVELLMGTTVVNSLFLYNKVNRKSTSIIKFRENLCSQFLHYGQPSNDNIGRPPRSTHKL